VSRWETVEKLTFLFNKLEAKMTRYKKKGRGQKLSKKLVAARKAEEQAVPLSDDVAVLLDWLRDDILALVGDDLETRKALFDFVVEELRTREQLAPHRITPLRKKLENQRDELLAFVPILEKELADLARVFQVSPSLVRGVYELQSKSLCDNYRAQQHATLQGELGGKFYFLQEEIKQVMTQVVRASSIIENLNSRLRNYFFLRRHLGAAYLGLLRFFLNHRCFMRSQRAERVGRSPAELMTGEKHPHWLELLGFQPFRRPAN